MCYSGSKVEVPTKSDQTGYSQDWLTDCSGDPTEFGSVLSLKAMLDVKPAPKADAKPEADAKAADRLK